ncbi:MAG: MOSC domain-containing protein [Woeseia sp.]
MQAEVVAVLTGKTAPFGPKGELSAYRKKTVAEVLQVGSLGIVGDEQADPRYHGGPDKAILQYASEHYAIWQREQPHLIAELSQAGAFGENISSTGLDETTVCIGDRYRLGTAVVEVSQARQPCWKLGHRFGDPGMVEAVVLCARSGWYYRVLEPGAVAAGDEIEFLERPYPQWPTAKVFELLIGGGRDKPALRSLSKLDVLSGNWRERARRKLRNLKARDD